MFAHKKMNRTNLDAQSSTPPAPEVIEAMRPYFSGNFASAASAHYSGKQVRKAIERAREQIAAAISASDVEEIVFTGSGTEANNLAVKGILAARRPFGNHVISTPLDHPSVWFSIQSMISQGFEHEVWEVDAVGRLPGIESLGANLRKDTILASVPVSTPELGVVQPVHPISEWLESEGVALMLDATTAGGWTPLDVSTMKPSLMSLSPHRFHGPKGVGVLYRRRGVSLEPLMHGGNQEFGLRAGTENVASIVGAGKAFELMSGILDERIDNAFKLQSFLHREIKRKIPFTGIIGPAPGKGRLSNQLNLVFEGVEGEALMLMTNVRGLDCHTGIACVNRHMESNRIPKAVGLPDDLFRSSLLLSWHEEHTMADLHEAVEIIAACVGKLREMSPVWNNLQCGRIPSRLSLLP